ncbi:MAG TPA: helicase-related protein [Stellaceae bacterium]|nr:helicase-related protein [Stellaceae bacterium]
MGPLSSAPRLVAVLGPTNTGKTHYAIERMLGHQTGMIGFPLRLLARENYDRVVKAKGARAVALITGEEKILPPNPSYFVCTVESMPLDRSVDFLAVDEIQLCADPERGHVFTQRLLEARGRHETLMLGSDTIKPLLRRLVPDAEVTGRPRFSTLRYTGVKKVTRLPPRSAVVAFAVADVFALAELMRRQRGGAAVVMGALSPRARNAQVGLFQSGEVDYLVATDAIGMGLNMDLDHVAFAKLVKFDGTQPRHLMAPEIAQIAGRAGRHMSDGTFGVTADEEGIDPETVEAVENHRFDPLTRLYWRNSRLEFRSVGLLLKSLEERPRRPGLVPAREADDHRALRALGRMEEIAEAATTPAAVRLLWEVCQIPDFRKVMSDTHARLLAQIYRHLSGPTGRLPADWVANHVARLDRTDGDIDSLMARIAHVRTWTFISHRADWLADAPHWQERARAIEDRLSDALHDRITQRFVDRRAAFLVRQLAGAQELLASVSRDGEVKVEGHYVGKLEGFRFRPDTAATDEAARTLLAAANRVLRSEIADRAAALAAAPADEFALTPEGVVLWRDGAVARLTAGDHVLQPKIDVLPAEFLDGAHRETARRRIAEAVRDLIRQPLAPLFRLAEADLEGASRGLAYRLVESLGTLPLARLDGQAAALDKSARKRLAQLGVRLGTEVVYVAPLLNPRAAGMAAMLWAVCAGAVLPVPSVRGASPVRNVDIADGLYEAMGYRVLGPRALRVDRVERLAMAARRLARQGPFGPLPELAQTAGCRKDELAGVLAALGYRAVMDASGVTFHARRRPQARKPVRHAAAADGPFAKLGALRHAR